MDKIEFTVKGEPRPKGSKNAFVVNFPGGKDKAKVAQKIKNIACKLLENPWSWRPITTVSEVSKHLKKWEKTVTTEARRVMLSAPWPKDTPVRLVMEFYLKRPQAHTGTGKNEGIIKDRFKKELPLKTPDLSKLFRAAEDGLNEVVFDDDCQVVEMVAKKRYGITNGVRITVEKVDFDTVAESEHGQLLLFNEGGEL